MVDHGTSTSDRAGEQRPDGGDAHLVLRAADAVIAVPAANALEIWHPERCHPVPGTPPYVIGIASFRGAPVPLIDLAGALDLGGDAGPRSPGDVRRSLSRAALDGRRAVLASTASFLVGLVVDGTLGVVDITPEQMSPPKVVGAGRLPELMIAEVETPRWGVAAVLELETFLDAVRVRS